MSRACDIPATSMSDKTNKKHFLSMWIIFVFTNSVDPDEMSHYAFNLAFNLGLHCFAKVRVKESVL